MLAELSGQPNVFISSRMGFVDGLRSFCSSADKRRRRTSNDDRYMIPTYCQECGRTNGGAAKRCLWCGVPLIDKGAPDRFEPTRVEIDYLDGIERLDDPLPVRLVINADGVEVSELMPGSRTYKIAAAALVEASVVDASVTVEAKRKRPALWRIVLTPFGRKVWKEKPGETKAVKQYDYVLTIRYRAGDAVRIAVFHRQDRIGLQVVDGLARIINLLVRITASRTASE